MPADEVTRGTDADGPRARTGPRHAAPRKPLFNRFHMPAGKAIASVAMPTAVLVGMGFTSTFALADNNGSPSPSSTAKSLTADEYKDCVKALDDGGGSADSSASPSPSAPESTPASPAPSPTGAGEQTHGSDAPSSPDSGSDDETAPEPAGTAGSSDSGSTGSGSAGSGSSDSTGSGKSDSGSTGSGSTDAGSGSGSGSGSGGAPAGTQTGGGGGVLDTIGDTIGDILTGGHKDSGSGVPAATPTASATPTPSASASSSPAGGSSGGAGKPGSGASGTVRDTAGKTADEAGDTAGKTADKTKDTAGQTTDKAGDTAGKATGKAGGVTAPVTPTPSASESASADGCPVATDDEGGVDNKVLVADDPWYLNASSLLLKGADYQGIVEVKAANGTTKKVLKYVISSGTDIGDLHQTVKDEQAGKTYHVQAAKGSTSTITGGDTVMYTESISGNLFGLIPVTFSPDSPPPLNIPLIYFTDVKVVQAAQFGGNLHVPGMHLYTTD